MKEKAEKTVHAAYVVEVFQYKTRKISQCLLATWELVPLAHCFERALKSFEKNGEKISIKSDECSP